MEKMGGEKYMLEMKVKLESIQNKNTRSGFWEVVCACGEEEGRGMEGKREGEEGREGGEEEEEGEGRSVVRDESSGVLRWEEMWGGVSGRFEYLWSFV